MLVVGQITCWLVFIFSNFAMPKKWKNGKIGVYGKNSKKKLKNAIAWSI